MSLMVESPRRPLHPGPPLSAVGHRSVAPAGHPHDPRNKHLDQGEPAKVVLIDQAYIETNTPAVRDCPVEADVRLAGLLNQALRG
jgi:hypothetical protein